MCCGVEVPFEMAPQHIHQILNGRNGNNMKRLVVVHLCAEKEVNEKDLSAIYGWNN